MSRTQGFFIPSLFVLVFVFDVETVSQTPGNTQLSSYLTDAMESWREVFCERRTYDKSFTVESGITTAAPLNWESQNIRLWRS